MSEYILITDSSCDLTDAMARELELEIIPLSVTISDDTYQNFLDEREIPFKDFYARLRAGEMAKTSAVNTETFLDVFAPHLEAGRDVLYLAFSSGLSVTCECALVAAQSLAERFPERKVRVVDTLCASMGQGLIAYLAARKRREKSITHYPQSCANGVIAQWNLCVGTTKSRTKTKVTCATDSRKL